MEYEVTREYLTRRYRDSLAMAERATDPAIARVHREFAAKYAQALDAAPLDRESAPAMPLPAESADVGLLR